MTGLLRSAVPIAHGYTLHDLDQMARAAVVADRLMASPMKDRYDTAWSAIAEHLYSSEERPERRDLVQVGWKAIYREVRDGLRQRGYADGERDWSDSSPTMPRFAAYWSRRVTPSHEDWVVERFAAQQVFALLAGPYRDAVVALAVHDDYVKAAEALGISYTAITVRLTTARRRFLSAWYGEETARPRRTDRRVKAHGVELSSQCSAGHEWTPENTRHTQSVSGGKVRRRRFCRACERDRGRRRALERRAPLAALRDGGE